MREPEFITSKTISNPTDVKPTYDDIQTTQQAINMAVAENRVVRYLTRKSSKEIMAQVDDKKGCKLLKPDRESEQVAIVPAGINDFDFENVDTTIVTAVPPSKSKIILPFN